MCADKKNGKMIVIVAPSGSGKSTLIKMMKADFPSLNESISFTTRAPREGEKNGVHYHFIAAAQFEKMIADGEFLEWAKVHNNYYGTSKTFVEKQLADGKDILFDIDVQGADAVKKIFKEKAQIIFISPPSIEELEKRLLHRGTDSREVINVRLKNAEKEMLKKNDYDFCVVNDALDTAYAKLKSVVLKIFGGTTCSNA